jgi:hypothetical protein
MNAKLAPSAKHLKTSLPVLTPPSISIGIYLFIWRTEDTIFGRTSIVAGTVSSCLPP